MKHIQTITRRKDDGTTLKARVRFDGPVDEYVVDFSSSPNGSTVFHPHRDATYYTDDEQDAINTAKWWTGAK